MAFSSVIIQPCGKSGTRCPASQCSLLERDWAILLEICDEVEGYTAQEQARSLV